MLSLALSAADLCYPALISEITSSIDGSRLWTGCLGRRCPDTISFLKANPTIKPRKSGNRRRNTRRGTRTTPRYSPISTPNSAACCSAFQRASSGKVKNRRLCSGLPLFSRCSEWDSRRAAPWAGCRALFLYRGLYPGLGLIRRVVWIEGGKYSIAGQEFVALAPSDHHRLLE